MDASVGQALAQQPMQVGAVHGQIRRAELRLDRGAERLAETLGGGVPGERDHLGRRAGERPQALLDAERAQHLHRVRAELEAGANLAQLFGALVKLDLAAVLAQRARGGEPADAGPDHRDANRPCHLLAFPLQPCVRPAL
jgi:hypothetical protein